MKFIRVAPVIHGQNVCFLPTSISPITTGRVSGSSLPSRRMFSFPTTIRGTGGVAVWPMSSFPTAIRRIAWTGGVAVRPMSSFPTTTIRGTVHVWTGGVAIRPMTSFSTAIRGTAWTGGVAVRPMSSFPTTIRRNGGVVVWTCLPCVSMLQLPTQKSCYISSRFLHSSLLHLKPCHDSDPKSESDTIPLTNLSGLSVYLTIYYPNEPTVVANATQSNFKKIFNNLVVSLFHANLIRDEISTKICAFWLIFK